MIKRQTEAMRPKKRAGAFASHLHGRQAADRASGRRALSKARRTPARTAACVHAGAGTHRRRQPRGCVCPVPAARAPGAPLLLCCLQGFGRLASTKRIELYRGVLAGAGAPFPRKAVLPAGDG
jgi:hypothetical protein